MFDQFQNGCNVTGEKVGTAWNAGIFTASGEKNKSEEKRQELFVSGRNLI